MSKKNNLARVLARGFVILFFLASSAWSQTGVRREISFPDILGLKTLKCDFHMHTVFSDGNVWPSIRVEEAWLEGLDGISITDHVDYQPHKDDVSSKHNRAYELALERAMQMNILLVRGTEMTYSMPPGHFNMIFIKDADRMVKEKYMDILQEARRQGAFIFWNHPSYPHPENREEWFPEHEEIYRKGLMMGIEVANGYYYYPKAHQWALDRKLTMMGNSDSHSPMGMSYDFSRGKHRPLTLVFARERSLSSIREALINRRTAVYWQNRLIGEKRYLSAIFKGSIKLLFDPVTFHNKKARLQVHNGSDMDLKLTADSGDNNFSVPGDVTLYAHKTVRLSVGAGKVMKPGFASYKIPYRVNNLLIAPDTGLPAEIEFRAYSLDHVFLAPVLKEGKRFCCLMPEKREADVTLRYTLDGSEPTKNSADGSNPFYQKIPFTLTYMVFEHDHPLGQPVTKTGLVHQACGKQVAFKETTSASYPGGGTFALTDGFIGSLNYRDGAWLGFEGKDLLATLDMGDQANLKSLHIRFLQKTDSWIFLPRKIEVAVSASGERFAQVAVKKLRDSRKYKDHFIHSVSMKLPRKKVRYIRLYAQSIGTCPDWHPGAGKKAWLFIDEMIVN